MYRHVRQTLHTRGLNTVCEHARCPNLGECWSSGTATFMILGDVCTRGCRFCAVQAGRPSGEPDPSEPGRVATAASAMSLRHAVVTSVTRDDLPDGGARIFAGTVAALKALDPPPSVELLIPDLLDSALEVVVRSGPDVLAHNIEVVARLTAGLRHRRFSYERSLRVLDQARRLDNGLLTKSSIMLGLGETDDEVAGAMADLRSVGVDILVLGQYLRPARENTEVRAYVPPETFAGLEARAYEMGFGFVASSPLARTSYRAAEALQKLAPRN